MTNATLSRFLHALARHLDDPKNIERRIPFNTLLDDMREDEDNRADVVTHLDKLADQMDYIDPNAGPRGQFLADVADMHVGAKATETGSMSTSDTRWDDEFEPRERLARELRNAWKRRP